MSCRLATEETPFAEAVTVAVEAAETALIEAEKLADVAPAATVTLAGTVTDAELSVRATGKPPAGAAAFRMTVQVFVPAVQYAVVAQLRLLTAAAGLSVMTRLLATLPALAVKVADCVEATPATVAEKLAEVALAATVTEEGTVMAALLLDRLTVNPPVNAAELRVTLQESLPEPVNAFEPQVREDRTGVAFGA